jgi:hypothetical protein
MLATGPQFRLQTGFKWRLRAVATTYWLAGRHVAAHRLHSLAISARIFAVHVRYTASGFSELPIDASCRLKCHLRREYWHGVLTRRRCCQWPLAHACAGIRAGGTSRAACTSSLRTAQQSLNMIVRCSGPVHVDVAADTLQQQHTAGICAPGCHRQRSSRRATNGTAACHSMNCYRSLQTQLLLKSTAGCVHPSVSNAVGTVVCSVARKCARGCAISDAVLEPSL